MHGRQGGQPARPAVVLGRAAGWCPAARPAGLPGRWLSRRGRVSRIASGWPSSQSSSSPNDRRSRGRCAAGNGCQQVTQRTRRPRPGSARPRPVIRRTWPSQPSSGAAGDQHRAAGVIPHPRPGSPAAARSPPRPAAGSPPAGSGISRTDSKLSHTSSARYCPSSRFTASSRCGGVQPGEVRAEHGQADLGDHPVQAEAGHAGLEGMPEHQPRVVHPAGIPPPPGEPLGQLGLPRPARTGQHHHPLQPGRGLQLVEQVIPAHEHAVHRRPAGPAPPRAPMARRGSGPAPASSDGARGRAGGAGLREADLPAQVVHRDQPVGQRHVPLRARPPVMAEQPPAARR